MGDGIVNVDVVNVDVSLGERVARRTLGKCKHSLPKNILYRKRNPSPTCHFCGCKLFKIRPLEFNP